MSDYQRIYPAISYYENLARIDHGVGFVQATAQSFSNLQANYYSKSENPDYGTNTKKFCYLYKYAVAHGYYIFWSLKTLRPKIKPAIFSRKPTRIACIGGGPGTEIIGLCRYLRAVEPENVQQMIEITVFDKEPTWEESCRMILACVGQNLNVTFKFIQFDATQPASFSSINFSGFHVVMANFFLSETRKAKILTASAGFWKHLFASMGTGKIFLAVDFADNDGVGWSHLMGLLPANHVSVVEHPTIDLSCPDSKACLLALEAEIDHRPKKNGTNFIKAIIT